MAFGRSPKPCPKVSEAVAKTRRKIERVSEGLGSRARRFRKQLRKKSVGRRLPFESDGRNTSEALRKLRGTCGSYFSRLRPIFEGGPFAARVRGEAVAKKVDKSMCFGRPRKLSPKVRGSSSEKKRKSNVFRKASEAVPEGLRKRECEKRCESHACRKVAEAFLKPVPEAGISLQAVVKRFFQQVI